MVFNMKVKTTTVGQKEKKAIPLRQDIQQRFNEIREFSIKLCKSLETEDYVIQSMPDVSPTKWHLAHVTWFFETFLLEKVYPDYQSPNSLFTYLFNSYYIQVGKRWNRPERGLLSRPTVKEVYAYRKYVDDQMNKFFEMATDAMLKEMKVVIEIGLNHEQQHQELILTDIKHVLSQNPLHPVFHEREVLFDSEIPELKWIKNEGGLVEIGYDGNEFFYDNEKPVHKEFLNPFAVANRLVTNKEFIEFIKSGGYKNSVLWLSDGIATVEQNNWEAPLYWQKVDGKWMNFTLNGFREVNPNEPVTHISYYEADAFARWANSRLLTEAEWEVLSKTGKVEGNFVENENYHPVSLKETFEDHKINQLFGDVWEWTQSPYTPYPGYKTPPGAIGEYNGKFMSNQMVLRGGSCVTSVTHIRNTYRNFFPPHARWQFTGIRLAKDL